MSNAIDLLAADNLATATAADLTAAARALFADCGFAASDPEALSNLGAMLADLSVAPATVDAVVGALVGASVADAMGLELAA